MKWETNQIKMTVTDGILNLKSRMRSLPLPCEIEVANSIGDYVTEVIRVHYDDDEWIRVYGFVTDKPLVERSEADVEMLVVETSPGYSGGGIQSDELDVCLSAQAIKAWLKTYGWEVVDSMDRYF